MKMRVAIPKDVAVPGKEYLLERGYEVLVGTGNRDHDYIASFIHDADAVLARTPDYSADVLSAAPRLKVVSRHGAGMDGFDLAYCRAHGIRVTNAPGANAVSVAEHTIGQLLGLAHCIPMYDRNVRRNCWEKLRDMDCIDLAGRTLGIIGYGAIGSLVAKKARAFDMRVLVFSPHLSEELPEGVFPAVSAAEVFASADFISLHLPLNERTREMVDDAMLSRMKEGSYLINNARGGIISEEALIRHLQSGHLAGVALDVFTKEPLPEGHPFLAMENVILTPHTAALTKESKARMSLMAAMGIDDVLQGREPRWPVV